MKNKISIIIPTFKRRTYLLSLLKSFRNRIPEGTEIIVVEQGETHKKDYEKIVKKMGFFFKYFFLKDPSTTKAKNIGAKNATGDYIVFFDDDVLLKTNIEAFLSSFDTNGVAAVTGRVITQSQKIEENNLRTGRITFLGKFSDGYSSKHAQEIDTVIGCNVCWKKDSFLQIGGFDEQFRGNALREESDLSLRAIKQGYRILFDPQVEVFHVRAETGGARKTEGRIKWYFDFFSNETYFFLKYRPFWSVPFIMLTRYEWVLRCMFGFGREVSMKSFSTPFLGYLNGYKKYRRYKNENRG